MSESNLRKKVSNFYDDYVPHQQATGINARHLAIYNNIKKLGLNSNSKVLEIGCGIGTFTHFLAKNISNGKILALDISPKSIEIAKKIYAGKSNMEFIVSDMSDFSRAEKFDIVVLPDVLEHIPMEQHMNVFEKIAKHLHTDSVILINIPSPRSLEWITKNKPDILQVIDQPLHTNLIIDAIYSNGLYIESLESYSVFYNEYDYQSIVLRPNKDLETMTLKTGLFLKIRRFILRKFHI